VVSVEAVGQAGEHRYDKREHFLASPNRARARYRALTVADLKRGHFGGTEDNEGSQGFFW
jgi:hypothetical protein